MKKYELKNLQASIKVAASEGRAFNPKIQAAKGLERYSLRVEKSRVGDTARYLLLAYAILRHIPYSVIEKNSRKPVYAQWLHKVIIQSHTGVTLVDVQEWLSGAEPWNAVETEIQSEAAQ